MASFKILPLAADSLGVRSLATYVETDVKILIDPGAALGPVRYGLPPSEAEVKRLSESMKKIFSYARKSGILTISHYHYDHYVPDKDIYSGKTLLIKDPKNKINLSQKKRAADFLKFLGGRADVNIADGKTFKFGRTILKFSPPVFHGGSPKLGYVLMVCVSYDGYKFVHASDVQGPQTDEATNWIVKENPNVLMLSGFPTLFLGWRFPKSGLLKSNENLIKIMKKTRVETIILDHHIVRDLHYKNKILPVLAAAEKLGKNIVTAAEFLGKKNEFLEARRKELFAKQK